MYLDIQRCCSGLSLVDYPSSVTYTYLFPCTDVAIWGARGSGEDNTPENLGMGTVPFRVAEAIRSRLPSNISVTEIGINYPAPGALSAVYGNSAFYLSSVATGADVLVNGFGGQGGLGDEVKRCPNVKVVLIGISQGANVVDAAVAPALKPTPVTSRINAILLFGDPWMRPHRPYNIANPAARGVLENSRFVLPGFGDEPPEVPSQLWNVTQSYCLKHDPICQFEPGNTNPKRFVDHLPIHDTYGQSPYVDDAAAFAIKNMGF
jgi:hypothetical protein